jgi:hypothetical protein
VWLWFHGARTCAKRHPSLHDTAGTHARRKNHARTQPAMHKTAHQMTRAPPYAPWLVTAWYWVFQILITYLDDTSIIQVGYQSLHTNTKNI